MNTEPKYSDDIKLFVTYMAADGYKDHQIAKSLNTLGIKSSPGRVRSLRVRIGACIPKKDSSDHYDTPDWKKYGSKFKFIHGFYLLKKIESSAMKRARNNRKLANG